MRTFILIGALIGASTVPALASAQTPPPGCVRQDNRAAGTVLGAVGGAVLGSAIAGRGDKTTGAVIGGVGGAIVGNQIAGSSVRCPEGYYRQDQVQQPVQNYDRRDDRGDRYDRGGYGYGAGPDGFWRGAPQGIREREDWLEQRIQRGVEQGTLDRREARRATDMLRDLRNTEQRLRRRDGGRLSRQDADYMQVRLDNLGQQITWLKQTGPRRY
ncbi:MAG TPA: glycine zipper 2TM domain-containing protein [Caulobacteraceae bacterium]|jgi:hypothetical protein|nr:glycine zipper 2TM domain-containing protein [Caulobacteraceae bacterium]